MCDESIFVIYPAQERLSAAVLSCVLDPKVIRGAQVVSRQRQVRHGSCSMLDLQGLPQ